MSRATFPAQSGFAPAEGTSLYYEVSGAGAPVVLLHGRGVDHRMWLGQVPALAARYRVVSYDLRGFGASPPGETAYAHSDDLAALLDHLGIDRIVPVGISLGGGAAIDFALLHPDRVRGLVAVDSSLRGFPWSRGFMELLDRIQREAVTSGVLAAKRMYLDTPLLKRALLRPGAGEALRAQVGDYSGWHWLHEDRGRVLVPPAIDRLHEIGVPTLAIVGELDLPDFHAIASTLEKSIPRARRVVLPGVGHVPNVEDPERFNALLLGFLDEMHARVAA